MKLIKQLRVEKGYSQREFAVKASMSFRGLQLLEEPVHDCRISSIRKVADALHLPADGVDAALAHFLEQDENSVPIVCTRINCDGFASWPLHLFDFVDTWRASPALPLIQSPPPPGTDRRIQRLVASTVDALCLESGIELPAWSYGVMALEEPWFVSGIESLKPMALAESPPSFRKRNIFVLGNFLSRA